MILNYKTYEASPSVFFVVLKWELRGGGMSFQKEQYGNFGILLHPLLLCFLTGKCWKASLKGHPSVPAYTGSLC